MPQIRRTGVFLHTGNPQSKARTPQSGIRAVKTTGIRDLDEVPKPKRARAKPSTPRLLCNWCGSPAKKQAPGTRPRCRRCERLESVITIAAKYLGQHGLRPLGASTESDSPEEAAHREAAAEARRELNSVWKSRSAKAPARQPQKKSARAAATTKKSLPTKKKTVKPPQGGRIPDPGRNDLAGTLRALEELRRLIEEEQRRGASDTGAGRARLGKLQQRRRELARKAAKLKASGNKA